MLGWSSLEARRISRFHELAPHHFDGEVTTATPLLHEIHHGEPAAAQLSQYFVVASQELSKA
jgi:hypothetical protein